MKIMLAVDGSPCALAAVHHAVHLIRQGLQASLVLINVQEPPSLYEVVTVHDSEGIEQLREDAGVDLLREAEALIDAAGVDYESEVAGGSPVNVIVELIENYGCEALMLGARGAGNPQASGIGSVAGQLLLLSPVPVTVAKLQPADSAFAYLPEQAQASTFAAMP